MSENKFYGIIYKIENLINKKIYIGQTVHNFKKRYPMNGEGIERVYNYHKYLDKYSKGKCNNHLVCSIEKYGFENFEVDEAFDFAYSLEELNRKETYWINYYDCVNNGYNRNFGGDNRKPTKETLKLRRTSYLKKIKDMQKIICLTDGRIFENQYDASWYYNDNYGINTEPYYIISACEGKTKSHGVLKEINEALVWMYYWDYSLRYHYGNIKRLTKSAVINVSDGNVFLKQHEVSEYYDISKGKVVYSIRKKIDISKCSNKEYDFMTYKNYINSISMEKVLQIHNKFNNNIEYEKPVVRYRK